MKTNKPRVVTRLLKDAGTIPNSRLPVLIYQGALDLPKDDPASTIEALIHANDWGNDWRNRVFTFPLDGCSIHSRRLGWRGNRDRM